MEKMTDKLLYMIMPLEMWKDIQAVSERMMLIIKGAPECNPDENQMGIETGVQATLLMLASILYILIDSCKETHKEEMKKMLLSKLEPSIELYIRMIEKLDTKKI